MPVVTWFWGTSDRALNLRFGTACLRSLLSPGVGCQGIELLNVIRIEIAPCFLFTHHHKKLFRQHRSNCVDGFMPVEPFLHQPKKYSLCREFVPERHLILDDHMYNGVDGLIRKPDSLPPVVSPDQLHALGFIEREPGI
jgi:hypothetical protein